MSDPFEIRLAFVSHLRHLQASQSSINKVVAYAMKFRTRKNVRDELWECILEECEKANLNARINIFYMVDSLCEASVAGIQKSTRLTSSGKNGSNGIKTSMGVMGGSHPDRQIDDGYLPLARRDLKKLSSFVVPDGPQGVLNRSSALQIIESWKLHRIFEMKFLEALQADIIERSSSRQLDNGSRKADSTYAISREEILHRMDEDRERHKRLRERSWVLPTSSSNGSALASSSSGDPSPASPSPASMASPSFHLPVHGRVAISEKPSPLSPGLALSQNMSSGPTEGRPDRPVSTVISVDNKEQETEAKMYLAPPSATEVEFDQLWNDTSSWNSDDESEAAAEIERWWPGCGLGHPDIVQHWRKGIDGEKT